MALLWSTSEGHNVLAFGCIKLEGGIEERSCLLIDPDDPYRLTEDTRPLGLVVCRGTAIVLICPLDGTESIPNPFVQQDA